MVCITASDDGGGLKSGVTSAGTSGGAHAHGTTPSSCVRSMITVSCERRKIGNVIAATCATVSEPDGIIPW